MIGNVRIRNFKSVRDLGVDLERFTIFVGPNASGKSSILQALDLVCRSFQTGDGSFDGVVLSSRSSGTTEPVELTVSDNGTSYRYRTRSAAAANGHARPAQWAGDGRGFTSDPHAAEWHAWKPDPATPVPLPKSVLLLLEAAKLCRPIPSSPDASVMGPDGVGLHSALASMALNDPDMWDSLRGSLRRIIPTITRLRHKKVTVPQQPAELLFDTVGADSVRADQVSEGTLLVLGLLVALHAADRPNLVLLDDLDRGLHPKAQRELIALLRELLKTNPDLQIVATTHSPYMLDCMEPEEVRMTQLDAQGATVCAPLTRHPKFRRWADEFHSGEMWSLFGEKWVVEPEAVAP